MHDPTPSAVAQLLEQIVRSAMNSYDEEAISLCEWSVLRRIRRPGRGGKTIEKMATYLGTNEEAVARLVTALRTKKLLLKARGSDPIELTPAGAELLAADPVHRIAAALQQLPSTSRQALAQHLERLSDVLAWPK